MRIFYAAEFPEAVKQAMADNIAEVKKHTVRGSFTWRDNFHLTFVFVGECAPNDIEKLKQAADSVVAKLNPPPIDVVIDGLGTFPRPDGAILWAGMKTQKVQSEPRNILSEINSALLAELRAVGINLKQEYSRFVPHVTIGRRVELNKPLELIKFKPVNFAIDAITIMESIGSNKGIIYEPLYRAEFIKKLRA